jgi:hypothetical protein
MSDFDTAPYKEQFKEEFTDPDNAGFYLNPDKNEANNYMTPPGVSTYTTEDAIDTLYGDQLSDAERDQLADELNGEYPDWVRNSDL